MLNVCPNCHFIGEDKHDFSSGNIHYGAFCTLFGFVFLIATFFSESTFFYKLIALSMVIIGLILIHRYIKGRVCPNCNYKDMIPLDKPEAVKLIKEFDLQPGVNNFPDTFNDQNPSSSFKAPEF